MTTQDKTNPTDLQIETLMSDWLGNLREEGSFIHKNTKGAITHRMRSDESLSEFVLGDLRGRDEADILRKAREFAQGTISGMTPKNVRVILGSNNSRTDGTTVELATKHFDRKDLSLGEKLDIFNGFAVHETCHLMHTDFDMSQEHLEKTKPELRKLTKTLCNILEDERIELLLGESTDNGGDGMPGLADYLAASKKYSFGTFEEEKKEKKIGTKSPVNRFLNTLLYAVRYPSSLTEEDVTEQYEELDAVRNILTPYPTDHRGVLDAADRITEVMKDIIRKEKEEKEQNQQQEQPEQKEQQDRQDDKKDTPRNGNDENEENKQDDPDNSTSDGQDGKTAGQNDRQPSEKELQAELEKALSSPDTEKLLDAISNSLGQSSSSKDEHNAKALSDSDEKEYANGECDKDTADGIQFHIHRIKGDKEKYEQSNTRIRKYIPAMAKALRCRTEDRDYELCGMKSGKLQTNKLVSLRMGNTNIFSKKGTVTTDSACICILIDESYSMTYDRVKGSRDAAVLIKEAVNHIRNLELFIYGFTTGTINIYQERKSSDRYALGTTGKDGGTPTAAAMELTAKRIRKLTQTPCLMLILTDGIPDDRNATCQQDMLLSENGFIPVGIDISGDTNVKDVFREAISTKDMAALALTLGRLVRRKLQKMMTIHDTL